MGDMMIVPIEIVIGLILFLGVIYWLVNRIVDMKVKRLHQTARFLGWTDRDN